jgi:hypothetical protein
MSDEQNIQLPPAAVMSQMVTGYYLSCTIALAARLGIADLLKGGPQNVNALARETGSHARSLYRMLRALSGVGVFTEEDNETFSLSPLGSTLRSDVPDSIRDFAIMIASDWCMQQWINLDYSIQTGLPSHDHLFGMPSFEYLGKHEEEGKVFNDAMTSLSASTSMAVVESFDFSGINTLVDVGGGHGFLLASILKKYPSMRGINYDAPAVAMNAKDLLAAYGVADRCGIVGGDFFESVPGGGDGYILKHIIHDWDDARCITILGNCHRVMQPGNRIFVVEMVVPEKNIPSPAKFLDLQMLVVLTGCERTTGEYRLLFEKAGFEWVGVTPTPSAYSVLEAVVA